MKVKTVLSLITALWVSVILVACGSDSSAPVAIDYSQSSHWLKLPATVDKPADVFYLYPTAWSNSDPNPQICNIDDPSMLIMAPLAFERQATAFETVGNVYAPYYRQDNNSSINRLEVIAGIPTLYAVAAFDYYIQHFNNNRPFILAGHSQGATVLSNLLSGYMKDHPDVYSRMVAAYVIGHPVTAAYLADNPHLKFAEGPDDTGVIISYNTEASVVLVTNPVLYGMVGRVINPLTWTTDETPVSNANNFGSIKLNPDGSVAKDASGAFELMVPSCDAQIDKTKGVLICRTVDVTTYSPGPPPSSAFPKGVYHTFDIPIFLICGCGSGTTTSNNNFPVVVFSDVHFDPFYDPSLFPALLSADASEWESVFKTSGITAPSLWGSDTNYPLLTLARSSIRQNRGASSLIIFTGDILGHNFPKTFFALHGSQDPPSDADVAAMKSFTDKTVAYSMQGFLNDSLTQLCPQLATDSTKQASYRGSYFSGHSYSNPTGNEFNQITNTTWPVYLCGIGNMDPQELIACVNAY